MHLFLYRSRGVQVDLREYTSRPRFRFSKLALDCRSLLLGRDISQRVGDLTDQVRDKFEEGRDRVRSGISAIRSGAQAATEQRPTGTEGGNI